VRGDEQKKIGAEVRNIPGQRARSAVALASGIGVYLWLAAWARPACEWPGGVGFTLPVFLVVPPLFAVWQCQRSKLGWKGTLLVTVFTLGLAALIVLAALIFTDAIHKCGE
jgi:hypothetical protein